MKKKFSIMLLAMLIAGINAWAVKTLNNPTAADIKNCTDETLIVTGTLSAEAIAALQELNSNVKNVLLNQATVADDAAGADFKFNSPTVENIVLPKDLDEVKPEWFGGCTNLNSAVSYSTSGTSISAYINKSGTLQTTVNTLSSNGTSSEIKSPVEEAILSGNVGTSTDIQLWNGIIQAPKLKHLDLTNTNLKKIPNTWFNNINAPIEQIDLPKNLEEIEANSFNNCANLTGSLFIPHTCTKIGEKAFYNCAKITEVEFESGFTSLDFGEYVFQQCKGMKHIVLPEGVTSIGKGMFSQCESLESLRLPNTLKSIGEEAFDQTFALKYLVIPEAVEEIGRKAFYNSGITDLYLMQTDPTKLPKIYYYYDGDQNSTFGRINLDGNPMNIKPQDIKDYLKILVARHKVEGYPDMTESELEQKKGEETPLVYFRRLSSYLTSEQMEEIYRSKFSDNHASMVFLHYVQNDAMEAFLNTNVYNTDEYKSHYWTGNGAQFPGNRGEWGSYIDAVDNQEWEAFKSTERLTDTYGYVDANGVTWPAQDFGDYDRRKDYGNSSKDVNKNESEYNQQPTRIGWRQFVLIKGTSLTNDEIYSKMFDDTWYTICFPFDLTDEQLETAFNSKKYNICEFSGAAIYEGTKKNSKNEDVKVNNLVLCFTQIGYTWYKDKYGDFYYRTRDDDANKTKHYWKVNRTWKQNDKGVWDWYPTTASGVIVDDTNCKTLCQELKNEAPNEDIWKSVDGYLTLAGHPYMVHPYKVETLDGKQNLCTIPKVVYKHNFNKRTAETYDDIKEKMVELYNSETVKRPLYNIDKSKYEEGFFDDDEDGITKNHGVGDNYGRYEKLDASTSYGYYSFKGSFLPESPLFTGEPTEEVIPERAYFLGVPSGKKYPKFFRETSKSTSRKKGLWKQYSAIILLDNDAKSWEDANLDMSGSSTGAKGFNMLFGDFGDAEETTPDAIEEIIAEAEQKGQQVERVNIIVNINGQVVRQGTDMHGLPSGIYIVNGKKYFVK